MGTQLNLITHKRDRGSKSEVKANRTRDFQNKTGSYTHTLRLTPRHMSLTQGQGKRDKLERQWDEGPDMDTRQTRETRSKTQR